jgi:hypothetical protein
MSQHMRTLLATIVLLVALATSAAAYDVDVTCSWTAPTEGSPVVTYVLEVSENGGPFVQYATTQAPQTSVSLTLESWNTYVARVAGIDAQGRQGPWSDPSDPYTPDNGPPGAPQNITISE